MATLYPIILVHGIMLKDIWKFKAFGKIESVIRNEGNEVFTSTHDGLGSIENNAVQIKAFIDDVLCKTNSKKVNIVAHSKGGLDVLYMIDKLDMCDKIASVTFLSTPHKGSVIAEKLYDMPKLVKSFLAFWLNFWYRIFGDKKPDALTVCQQLKLNEDGAVKLSENHRKIFMQSYSSTLEKSRDDFVMGIPLYFTKKFTNLPSDGMVSVESSKIGEYKGNCTNISLSHSEMVDVLAKKKKKDEIYGFYKQLCKELEESGF